MYGAHGVFFALLDSLSGTEILVVLVVALIVLGPEKLPGVARQIGEWAAKLRNLTQNLQTEMRDVLDDPMMKPIKDLGEFAAQPRRKITELALAAEAEANAEAAAAREAAAVAAADQSAGEAVDADEDAPSDAEVAAEVAAETAPSTTVDSVEPIEPAEPAGNGATIEPLPTAPTPDVAPLPTALPSAPPAPPAETPTSDAR